MEKKEIKKISEMLEVSESSVVITPDGMTVEGTKAEILGLIATCLHNLLEDKDIDEEDLDFLFKHVKMSDEERTNYMKDKIESIKDVLDKLSDILN